MPASGISGCRASEGKLSDFFHLLFDPDFEGDEAGEEAFQGRGQVLYPGGHDGVPVNLIPSAILSGRF